MGTELYRHYAEDGELLYVGISLSTAARLAQHRRTSAWFDRVSQIKIERYATRGEAEDAERKAIRSEKPTFNVTHGTAPNKRVLLDRALREKSNREIEAYEQSPLGRWRAKGWNPAWREIGWNEARHIAFGPHSRRQSAPPDFPPLHRNEHWPRFRCLVYYREEVEAYAAARGVPEHYRTPPPPYPEKPLPFV